MTLTTDKQQADKQRERARRREARLSMTAEVKDILTHSEDEGLLWTAPVIDLMEALYYVYEEGALVDDNQQPMAFLELVRRCTAVLHVKMPANPYRQAQRGRERKGVKHTSFLERYMTSILISTYIGSCRE